MKKTDNTQDEKEKNEILEEGNKNEKKQEENETRKKAKIYQVLGRVSEWDYQTKPRTTTYHWVLYWSNSFT